MENKLNQIITLLYIIVGMLLGMVIFDNLFGAEATVSWDAPTTNQDGTPLIDLSGYKIYYGTSSGNYDNVINVGNSTSYTVTNLDSNTTYYFAITALDFSGNESSFSEEVSWKTDDTPVEEEEEEIEETVSTAYNYKNPFNADAGTKIVFITEKSGNFSIDIYNIEGTLVKNLISDQEITEGTYKFKWNSTDNNGIKVNPGVYLGKLKLDAKTIIIKMVVK